MKKALVYFSEVDKGEFEKGLNIRVSEVSETVLSSLLSHALGYIDYHNPVIVSELKEKMKGQAPKGILVDVTLDEINAAAFENGLRIRIEELTDTELTKALSHALGFVDYSNEGIAKDLLEFSFRH